MAVTRTPCCTCQFRLVCPESEDRSPLPPVIAAPKKGPLWEGLALWLAGIGICLVPFLMGFGISLLEPRTPVFTDARADPTPFLTQIPPRPKYIAEK
jgi:hypothetical protein